MTFFSHLHQLHAPRLDVGAVIPSAPPLPATGKTFWGVWNLGGGGVCGVPLILGISNRFIWGFEPVLSLYLCSQGKEILLTQKSKNKIFQAFGYATGLSRPILKT